MADKVNIVEINIDMDKVIKDTIQLKKELADLKETSKEFISTEDKMTQAYIENQAAIKATNELIRKNETITKNVVKANMQNTDSIAQMESQLAAVTAEWSKYSAAEIAENKEAIELNQRKTQLTETLKELKKATGDHRMEVGNYGIVMKDLKKELQELKGIMMSNAEGSKEYNDALKRSAQITDDLAEMQARVKGTAMNLEGVMGNVGKVGQGVASAFEAAQGAAALFGEENENLQKAMLKVQASIALANGLQGLEGMGKAFGNLLTQIKTFASGVNKALISTGIGALVVLVGSMVAYWDDIKQAVTGVGGAQRKLNDLAQANLKTQEDATKMLEAGDNILKAQGKSEREIIELKKQAIAAEITKAEIAMDSQKRIHKAQIDAEARNQAILMQMLEPLKVALSLIDQTFARLGKLVGKKWDLGLRELTKDMSEIFFDPQEMKDKFDKEQAETELHVRELWNKYYGLNEQKKKLNEKDSEDLGAELEKQKALFENLADQANSKFQETSKKREEMLKTANEAIANFNKQLASELQDGNNNDLEAAKIDYDNQLALAQDNIFQKLYLEQVGLEQKRMQEVEYAEKIGADTYAINEKYARADEELERAKQDAKLALASEFMGNIATIFGEGTAIGKAAAIAQTTISTYQAATGAYAALAPIPVVGPALGIAAAAAAIAAGLANVKKILSVKSGLPGESASGSSASVSGSSSNQATYNPVAPTTNQGIISRETLTNNIKDKIVLQPTLVIDDVNNAQNSNNANNKTAVL